MSIHCTLVYPPITDPTCGYLSLTYLAAAVSAARPFRVDIIDANLDGLEWCAGHDVVKEMLGSAALEMAELRSNGEWDETCNRRFAQLAIALSVTPDSVGSAIAVLKDGREFYDYKLYFEASLVVRRWLTLVSTRGIAGTFGDFNLNNPAGGINWFHSSFFADPELRSRIAAPFLPHWREVLCPELKRRGTNVVGIGVTYHEQLVFALAMAAELKGDNPDLKVVLGGTEISQLWKYTRSSGVFDKIFEFADALVIGEGESALIDILDAYNQNDVPVGNGILTGDDRVGRCGWQPRVENISQLPTPSFDALPLNRYWAPEPFIYYAPTRGCYWDRCTFCDYGLAGDRPTAPWRQRSVEKVLEDLQIISERARFVYFSVDVIAPAYLLQLARGIIARGIDIRWGAELRLEKYFSSEHCLLLRQSGCVGLSVGFESGCQRILDLIDKGIQVAETKRVIAALAEADIGVQIMGFTGFPSESYADALESIDVLRQANDTWVLAAMGQFALTAGAIVAKQADRFGITNLRPREGDDIHVSLLYDETSNPITDEESREIRRLCAGLRHPFELGRPFVGGTDTAHTYMYLERYGRSLRSAFDKALGSADAAAVVRLRGTVLVDAPDAVLKSLGEQSGTTDVAGVFITEEAEVLPASSALVRLWPLLNGEKTLAAIDLALHSIDAKTRLVTKTCLLALQDSRLLRFSQAE